jgi:hypothetical protein
MAKRFQNTITRACQPDEPPQFYGGIVADPMGLGKTLTMIALVATDIDADKTIVTDVEETDTDLRDVAATLVIIPPPSKHNPLKAFSNTKCQCQSLGHGRNSSTSKKSP